MQVSVTHVAPVKCQTGLWTQARSESAAIKETRTDCYAIPPTPFLFVCMLGQEGEFKCEPVDVLADGSQSELD